MSEKNECVYITTIKSINEGLNNFMISLHKQENGKVAGFTL